MDVQVPLYRSGFLGLGFAEIGSVSARAAAGNAKPRQVGGRGGDGVGMGVG
jgi:dihydroorotate dehydrogenase